VRSAPLARGVTTNMAVCSAHTLATLILVVVMLVTGSVNTLSKVWGMLGLGWHLGGEGQPTNPTTISLEMAEPAEQRRPLWRGEAILLSLVAPPPPMQCFYWLVLSSLAHPLTTNAKRAPKDPNAVHVCWGVALYRGLPPPQGLPWQVSTKEPPIPPHHSPG